MISVQLKCGFMLDYFNQLLFVVTNCVNCYAPYVCHHCSFAVAWIYPFFGFSGVIFVLFITKFVLIVYNSIAICDTYYFSPVHCTHCLCQHGKWYCKPFSIGNISTGIVFSLILPYQTLPQNSSKKSSCCERKSCIRYCLDCHTQTERLVEKQNAQLIGSSNVGYDGTHRGFGYGSVNADGSRI